ncbi:uncharacterized protein LOC126671967 [Mercurialis annua]|uniref:uncharacterized protein LOC126671967 n=1 Tax=Mercurialis annua TaxID=3986 RepID=UPI00215FC007|nr:uncharacterized protein LOC126671967 [Mercurialis annua]
MAGMDSKKQFLNLIRDCVSEKSRGERRLIGLKKRIDEIISDLESTNAELELSKRLKETAEQEFRGYEVELSMNVAFIQSLEARNSHIQDDISSIGSEIESLKIEAAGSRDEFIWQMFELNTKIRKFQETVLSGFQKENSNGTIAEPNHEVAEKKSTETESNALAHVISQTTKEEQEYLAEQNILKQVQQEYIGLERKVSLVGVIMKETKALQDLTRYP